MTSSNIIKVIGFSYFVLSFFIEKEYVYISNQYIFCLTAAGFLFSAGDFYKFKLFDNEEKPTKVLKIFRFLRKIMRYLYIPCFSIAIFFIIAMPHILENYRINFNISGNSLTIASIGLVITMIGFRESKREFIMENEFLNIICKITNDESIEFKNKMRTELRKRINEIDV